MKRLICAALTACALAGMPAAGGAAYSQMFVFGDSGSDPGNTAAITAVPPGTAFFPPSQPSGVSNPAGVPYNYRFSNGPVPPEYLAGLLNTPPSTPAWPISQNVSGANFAVGGAMTGVGPTIPEVPGVSGLCCNFNYLTNSPAGLQAEFPQVNLTGLNNQVDLFKARLGAGTLPAFDPASTLFYVQGGYNDIFLALALASNAALTQDQQAAILQGYTVNGALNMGRRIAELASLKAENFFVVNLFNLGRMPFVIEDGLGPVVTPLTLLFNSVLRSTLADLRSALDIDIIEFDSFAALDATIASGAFSNTTERCFDADNVQGTLPRVYGGCQGYLFFDGAHLTTSAYQISARDMARQLQHVPEPATWPLVLLAMAVVAGVRFLSNRSARDIPS